MTWSIRAAHPAEASTLARIHIAGRLAAGLPILGSDHETEAYHAALITHEEVRVCLRPEDGAVVGYTARWQDRLQQLYVMPDWFRRGVGAALMEDALARTGGPLRLWCFRCNGRALAFYAAMGGVEIEEDDGSDNDEGLPAVRFEIPFAS